MIHYLYAAALVGGMLVALPSPAQAVRCADGEYHAGCVGPNGAVTRQKEPMPVPPTYHAPPARNSVECANGPYRAGCVGSDGGAVVRKPY